MTLIAWDIETAPLPESALSEAQQARRERQLSYVSERSPDQPAAEQDRLVRSTHPFLGWICCISAVSGTIDDGPRAPKSWTATAPGEEADLIRAFSEAVNGFGGEVRWVTFNGKRFDVPFLEARTMAHGLSPTRADMRNTYPYNHAPHADLMNLWPFHYGLAGLCELLGVESPKGEMAGADVAGAVAAGEVARVARYCERDVVATFKCAMAARGLLSL